MIAQEKKKKKSLNPFNKYFLKFWLYKKIAIYKKVEEN